MPFAVGDVVAGRYEVQAVLGQRPLGVVYRAREREIGVDVSLLVLGSHVLPDEATRAAFAQRLGRARAFSHPNLVRVFGVYPTADEVVIATQWAPGQTLADSAGHQPFTVEEARPLIAQVAAGLTHAHQHGVVLGDVRADSCVLVGPVLKVSNAGIGPALPRKLYLEAVRDSPAFARLPPELRNGSTADSRADVYSLAMVLVEMLTGGGDYRAVPSPSKPLMTVLQRALADDPLVRHASIDALAHELEAALSGQPLKRRPTPVVGTPLNERAERQRAAQLARLDDSTAPVPKPDDVRPPSQEATRVIDEEELALLKGDQVTRQVPLDEIFPLRLASTETQEFERQTLLDEDADYVAADTYDELTLEPGAETAATAAPPPAPSAAPAPPESPPAAPAESSPPDDLSSFDDPSPFDARPPSAEPPPADDDFATEQVVLLEPDAVKTMQVPRLVDNNSPPPLDEDLLVADEVDTQRVKKLHRPPTEDTLTPLPPPAPPSATLTPLPPRDYAPPAPSLHIEAQHADGGREPTIEVTELPIEIDDATPPPARLPPAAGALAEPPRAAPPVAVAPPPVAEPPRPAPPVAAEPPPVAEPARPAPPVAAEPPPVAEPPRPLAEPSHGGVPVYIAEPPRPEPARHGQAPPRAEPRGHEPTRGHEPARAAEPRVVEPLRPVEPKPPARPESPPGEPSLRLQTPPRQRRNPFDVPPDVDDEAAEAPAPRKRRNPFDPVTADDLQALPPPEALKTRDGKRRRPSQPTVQVSPLSLKRRRPPTRSSVTTMALLAFAAAIAVALGISHWLTAQRLEQERRDKQRLADALNAKAQADAREREHPDAGAAAVAGAPLPPPVTHSEPLDTVLPRAGACPLGAKLVGSGSRAFCVDAYEYPGGNTIPRTTVSYAEASHICAARGERLCGESEWERACRGKGGASFPYGETYDATRCNTRSSAGEIAPAGAFATCKSASGAYDMLGNVAEWVSSGAQKGGSVLHSAKETRCSSVVRNGAREGSTFVGFRCCADPVPVSRR